jgi:hypothetical protein
VAEGLIQPLIVVKKEFCIQGIKVGGLEYITHLLFVDYILLFSHGPMREAYMFNNFFQLYCKVTGMEVNMLKYIFVP